jgi:glyoxylase-like metal-dependent hydrolase (beta-lactamase superfamily II)
MISFQNSRITVFQSALYHTTSSVITLDDCTIVVDPTWLPHEVREIREYVDQLGKGWPVYLLFTHSDWDHILGYGAFPEAKVIASEGFQQHPERADIVEQIRAFDDRYYLKRDYEITYPEADIVIDQDGQQLQLGQTTVTFYLAPGHTADGIITVIEPEGILLAGDYVSDIEFPYVYWNSMDYEKTMQKLEQVLSDHDIQVLVPGHGNVTTDPLEMQTRIEQSVRYLRKVRQYVTEGNQEELDAMLNHVPFPRGMKSYHEHNQQLIRKEIEQS